MARTSDNQIPFIVFLPVGAEVLRPGTVDPLTNSTEWFSCLAMDDQGMFFERWKYALQQYGKQSSEEKHQPYMIRLAPTFELSLFETDSTQRGTFSKHCTAEIFRRAELPNLNQWSFLKFLTGVTFPCHPLRTFDR